MPAIEALLCPNCGAPLPGAAQAGVVLCVYCNTAIRLQPNGPTQAMQPVVERSLDAGQMDQLKQLILDGRRDEAAAVYAQLLESSPDEAARSIEALEDGLSRNVILHQQLTPLGWLIFSGALLLLAACLWLGASGRLNLWIAGLLAVLALTNLAVTFRSLRVSLEFFGAPTAPARVLNMVPVGEVQFGSQLVHILKVLLEVQPLDRPVYKAEMLLPVRDANLERAAVGTTLKVKYRRDRPLRLVYDE